MLFNLKGALERVKALRVLHIDDDPDQLHFTKIFLEDCGDSLIIDSMDKPLEALKQIEAGIYDCIISDYQMDNMDGIELTKTVRIQSDIPIIIYTGKGAEEVKILTQKAGADAYFQKETDPHHYKILYYNILNLINKRKKKQKCILKKL